MTAVRVRPVRPGEEGRWYAVRPPRDGKAKPFTSEPGYRPETHLLAERGGVPVGRMNTILVEPHEVVLFHPVAADGADLGEVAASLVAEGVRIAASFCVPETTLLLTTTMPRLAELLPLAAGWGFDARKVKQFFRAKADAIRWELGAAPPGSAFRAAASPDDPFLRETFDRVLANSYESEDEAATELAYFADRCRRDGCLHVEDWEVLLVDSVPSGIVVPAFADSAHDVGTNFHVGLVPEARGKGLGAMLHLRGLAALRRRGAVGFIGSTDARNVPMQKVFTRVGYACTATQHLFTLRRS